MRLAGQLDSQNIVFIHLFESYKIVSLSWHDLSARVLRALVATLGSSIQVFVFGDGLTFPLTGGSSILLPLPIV